MGADYEPGTVAKATVLGVEGVRVARYDAGWVRLDDPDIFYSDKNCDDMVTDVRPLVVLDLDESQGKSWLADWLRNNSRDGWDADPLAPFSEDMRWIADQIEAQTKPPRIPEPGWSEKVLAHTLDDPTPREYVRFTDSRNQFSTKQWYGHGGRRGAQRWDDLIDPVLIRERVES